MTGVFASSVRSGECVISSCRTVIRLGDLVYLFKKLERQTVCLNCAKTRWGYTPENAPTVVRASEREKLSFDSTKQILRSLQAKANARDPKMRQSGDQ